MLAPAEIIRQHKEHLLRRLTSRSPLLNFRPRERGRVMDVHNLFRGITQNLPMDPENIGENGGCQNPGDFLCALLGNPPTPARIVDPARTVFATCKRIAELNRDYHYATGGWALYLGYPFIFVRRDNARNPFWAPLFFWKIKIKAQRDAVVFERADEGGEFESYDFNRVLASWLKKEENIRISPPDTEDICLEELPEIVRQTLASWRNCEMQFFRDAEPQPFVEPAVASPDAAVYPYAAVGYGEFKYQSLLNDLDSLGDKFEESNCGCLDFFLCPRSDEMDPKITPPRESGKILATEADASQERVIWQSRESRLTVLQGPPGTGKSQTIVNLIANALYREEKIAVICEKEPALNIVRKRMEASGLRNLAAKITQPRSNRKPLIESIRQIETDDGALFSDSLENHRLQKSEAIERREESLDDFHRELRPNGKPSRGNILARLDKIQETQGIDIRQPRFRLLREAIHSCFRGDFHDAENMKERIGQFVDDFNRCDYDNNPWRELKHDNPNAQDLRAIFSELMEDSSAILESAAPTSRASLHSDPDGWFAEHPLMIKHYPAIASVPEIQRQYGLLLDKTQNYLEEYLPHSVISGFLAEYRSDGKFNALSKCQAHLDTLDSLLAVRDLLRNDEIICALYKHLKIPAADWRHYFFAAALSNWLDKYPSIPLHKIPQIEDERDKLESSLREKQEFDRFAVTARFNGKLTARDRLEDQELLRIRGGRRNRKTTVRDLYHNGFKSLTEIYPVLLADPDSACQILPLEPGLFDLLVIDEASQMFTADALSLLYRTKCIVISGDRMQMPPSDFFSPSADGIEDGGEDEEDQEPSADANPNRRIPADGEYGLLEAAEWAILSGAPNRKKLEVHYRSRANELIDFSNRAFYDGKLQIPSGNFSLPSFLAQPIVLKNIGGGFSNSVNNDEIKEIIATLKEIWQNSRDYSVGVIVFNTTQRDALLDAFDQERDNNFRAWLAESRAKTKDGEFEGFFVRSVEHVQGDERDIIILGTTYDSESKNFGPINIKEKGRRRLNVAVTRAKVGMFVITSLDIGRISNQGDKPAGDNPGRERWFLWMYMKYAQAVSNGDPAMINAVLDEIAPPPPRPPLGEPESEFERQVGDFLCEQGYAVEYQVGESGFRIDIGVKEKCESKIYLCGIECDGAPYHSGWRARHRDIWRQSILEEKKGWKIYRVWSTQWFHNKEAAQQKLLREIECAQATEAANN